MVLLGTQNFVRDDVCIASPKQKSIETKQKIRFFFGFGVQNRKREGDREWTIELKKSKKKQILDDHDDVNPMGWHRPLPIFIISWYIQPLSLSLSAILVDYAVWKINMFWGAGPGKRNVCEPRWTVEEKTRFQVGKWLEDNFFIQILSAKLNKEYFDEMEY